MKKILLSGIEYDLTSEKINRINSAISETNRQIDREMKYSEQFRKNEDIIRWNQHIKYLKGLLA